MSKIKFIVLLLIAGIFYFLSMNYFFVGYFNDDASYINHAKGISRDLKWHSTLYPPIYPIILSVIINFLPTSFTALQIFSIIITLTTILLIFLLWKDELKDMELFFIIIFIAFNQLFLIYASAVMTEIIYLLFTLFFFLILKKSEDKSISPVLLSFFLVIPTYIHFRGLSLIIAVFLWFLFKRDIISFIKIFLFSLVFLLPLVISMDFSTRTSYFYRIPDILGSRETLLSHLKFSYENIFYYIQSISTTILIPLPELLKKISIIRVLLSFIVVLILLKGFIKNRLYVRVEIFYTVCYLLLHIGWISRDHRFLVPIIPWLFLLFFRGINNFKFLILILPLIFYQDIQVVSSSFLKKNNFFFQPYTYFWIKTRIPEDKTLLTTKFATVSLYTGKKTCSLGQKLYHDDLYYELVSKNISYVLKTPERIGQGFGFEALIYFNNIFPSQPNRYKLIYKQEASEIYEIVVKSRSDLLDAYKYLEKGVSFIKFNDLENAKKYLKKSLKLEPSLVKARNNLAVVYITEGKLPLSKKEIKKSLGVNPDYPITWAISGQINLLMKNKKKAKKDYEFGLKLLEKYPDTNLEKKIKEDLSFLETTY